MSIPPELRGAWRRVGLLIDGVRQVEYTDVLWLQTADWYADIRLRVDPDTPPPAPARLSRETAFAGTARWDEPRLTWEHVLDASPSASIDSSPLTWADGMVIEEFTIRAGGREVPVVEEWMRMADDAAPSSATVGQRDVEIRVGRWAIRVRDERPDGPFVATRSQRGPEGWGAVGSVTVPARSVAVPAGGGHE